MRETTRLSLLARLSRLDDQAAWREFDATYRGLILRYCRARRLQATDAEDVRQLVMLNLARGLGRFEYRPERGKFRDYLGRVVRNAIHRHFRRQNTAIDGLQSGALEQIAVEESHDDEWDRQWMLHHYRQALEIIRQTTATSHLEVFESLLSGEEVRAIADRHRLNEAAIYKIKQRIKDRLTLLITKQVRDEQAIDE